MICGKEEYSDDVSRTQNETMRQIEAVECHWGFRSVQCRQRKTKGDSRAPILVEDSQNGEEMSVEFNIGVTTQTEVPRWELKSSHPELKSPEWVEYSVECIRRATMQTNQITQYLSWRRSAER